MKSDFFFCSGLGLLIGLAIPTVFTVSLASIAFIAVLAVVLLAVSRNRNIVCGGLFLLLLCVGLSRGIIAVDAFDARSYEGVVQRHNAVVIRDPERGVVFNTVLLKDRTLNVIIKARIEKDFALRVGDVLTYSASLTQAESFMGDYGRVFDYRLFLRARGVHAVAEDISGTVTGSDSFYAMMRGLYDVKYTVAGVLKEHLHEPESGLAQAMLLGFNDTLDKNEERVFRNIGIIHIVVLSGYHIMTLFLISIFVISHFTGYRMRYIFSILVVLIFGLMVGITPTVARALIMTTVVACSFLLARRATPLRSIIIAAAILSFINPYAILYDVGFQFSFLATIGIVVVAPVMVSMMRVIPHTFHLRDIVAATVATELLILPLIAWSMGQFPLIGVVANILVLPVVPFAMLSSLMTSWSAVMLPFVTSFFAYSAMVLHRYIIAVAHLLDLVPYAHLSVPSFSLYTLGVLYLGVVSVIFFIWYRFHGLPVARNSEDSVDVTAWTIESMEAVKERIRAWHHTDSYR